MSLRAACQRPCCRMPPMRRRCTCAQSRAPEPPSADPASRCARLAGTPRSTGRRRCLREGRLVRSTRAWEMRAMQHPHRRRPESEWLLESRQTRAARARGNRTPRSRSQDFGRDRPATPHCRRRQRLVQARAPPRGRARAGLAASSSPLCRTCRRDNLRHLCGFGSVHVLLAAALATSRPPLLLGPTPSSAWRYAR